MLSLAALGQGRQSGRSTTISGYFGNALCNAVRSRVAIAIRKKRPGYVIILKKENEIFLIHTGGRIPA
jgi:hypothetical protein